MLMLMMVMMMIMFIELSTAFKCSYLMFILLYVFLFILIISGNIIYILHIVNSISPSTYIGIVGINIKNFNVPHHKQIKTKVI